MKTDEQIIEEAARALVEHDECDLDALISGRYEFDTWDEYIDRARAAFAIIAPAIREQCADVLTGIGESRRLKQSALARKHGGHSMEQAREGSAALAVEEAAHALLNGHTAIRSGPKP